MVICRYYTVRCDSNRRKRTEAVFRRVARKCLRLCPPALSVRRWALGDVVEICYDNSWKLASVVRAIDGDNYLVKIIGIDREFKARKCDIRVRLIWNDDIWIRMGKAGCAYLDIGVGSGGNVAAVHINNATDSHAVQSRFLKRTFPRGSSFLIDNGNKKQTKGIDRKHQLAGGIPKAKEVDVFAHPKRSKGGKYLCSPSGGAAPTYYNLQSLNPESFEHSVLPSCEFFDSECSVASSVGSCRVFGARDGVLHSSDVVVVYGDADFLWTRGHEDETCMFSREETAEAELHRLELSAYRKTLNALYASGPFSWEKEELLTSVRLSLHISNDEHLLELKKLGSAVGRGGNLLYETCSISYVLELVQFP